MNGSLDETLIWGRSLSGEEVAKLYENKGLITSVSKSAFTNRGLVPIQILVNPNPNDGIFQIKLKNIVTFPSGLELLNVSGQSLLKKKLVQGEDEISVQVDSLPTGVYYLNVKNQVQQKTIPVVINK